MTYPKFYTFDGNRRVYEKDAKGYGRGAPIYSEHFSEIVITGETETEYIGPSHNINKRSMKAYWKSQPRHKMEVYTEQDRADAIWLHDHRYRLTRKIDECRDVAVLKAIAELVGYEAA